MKKVSNGTRAFAVGISVLMALSGTPIAAIAEEAEPQAVEQLSEGLPDEQVGDNQSADEQAAIDDSATGETPAEEAPAEGEAPAAGDTATTDNDAVADDDANDDAVEVTASDEGDEVEVTVDGESTAGDQATDEGTALQTQSDEAALKTQAAASVTYRTQIQKVGWQGWRKDGSMSGTSGKARRLEAIKVKLSGVSGGIKYRTHVQKKGWQGWKSNGATSGTVGKGLRLEAIQIKLTGAAASQCDVWYRVHAQKFGWMGWARNGSSAGTEGYAYRLEAIEIKVLPKGSAAPGSTVNSFCKKAKSSSKKSNNGLTVYSNADFRVIGTSAANAKKLTVTKDSSRAGVTVYNVTRSDPAPRLSPTAPPNSGRTGTVFVYTQKQSNFFGKYIGRSSTGKYVYSYSTTDFVFSNTADNSKVLAYVKVN